MNGTVTPDREGAPDAGATTTALPRPRPGLLEIAPYVGGESRTAEGVRAIKLSSNEGALGPSPQALAAYRALTALERYPEGGAVALREAIGAAHGLDPARIVCGAGSDELIGLLCHAYAEAGDEVLYSRHGFLMYPLYARAAGALPVAAPERDLTADVDALLALVTPRTRILFLANPNNPTGTMLRADDLRRLREGLPADVLLVVDAAYAEFVRRNDYSTGIDLVDAGENTVMTRTFSKMYGLGGLRLGWCYAPASVVDVLNRVRSPFNVNAAAQAAGCAAVRDAEHLAAARAHNARWLDWMQAELRALGLWVTDSQCNFALARFPETPGRTAAAADAFLRQGGVIVRRMESYGLPACLRITVGREDEVRRCMELLRGFMEQAPGAEQTPGQDSTR